MALSAASQEDLDSLKAEVADLRSIVAGLVQERPIEWLTVKQAAEKLGKHEDTVYMMARDGRLTRRKDRKSVLISAQSVQEYNSKHTIHNINKASH